ncbi:unnamed protein product [Rhizophagus irregularis]|nr:unnamed protein product [Rhizophagus irregularis]
MVNGQEWLDKNYPKDGVYRGFPSIILSCFRIIDIWAIGNLSGSLKLESFNCWINSLTELDLRDCSNNKLTELDTSNCPRIEKLICDGNQLNQEIVQNLQSELERERTKTKFLMSQLEEKKSKTNEPQLSSEKNKHHSVKYIKKTFFLLFSIISHTQIYS